MGIVESGWVAVPLDDHYSNRGVGGNRMAESGSFTVLPIGAAYPEDLFPPPRAILRAGPMGFAMPDKEKPNNIECMGQTIAVPRGRYSELWVLGASETGSFIEPVELHYDDCIATALLGLTSWVSLTPLYGELPALSGDHVYRDGRTLPTRCRLWAQNVKTDPTRLLHSITLPDCPAMRIFAMSLREGNQE